LDSILIAAAVVSIMLSVNFGTSLYDAVNNIDKTEKEAARSIGFSKLQAFWFVIFPQAIKRIFSEYANGFVELLKAAAIAGYIVIFDLFSLFASLVYLVITTVSVVMFKFIVKRISKGARI